MKIIHAPTDLGMRAVSLSEAERTLGHTSKVFVRAPSVHVSGVVDTLYHPSKLVFAARLAAAVFECARSDIVMLNAGSSLVDFGYAHAQLMDVTLYRLLKKRVVTTFQGCDVRLCETCPVRKHLGPAQQCSGVPKGLKYSTFDKLKLQRLARLSEASTTLLGITPDLCLSSNRVQYSPHAKSSKKIGSIKATPRRDGSVFRIAHMPKRHHKGSEIIEPVIRNFCKEHPGAVEYRPIRGMSWSAALRTIASSDLVVDQVLTGWYGGVSVEAALLGVPSLVRIENQLLRFVPAAMRAHLPVVALQHADQLHDMLSRFFYDREMVQREGERCRQNARTFHNPVVVAKDILHKARNRRR